MQRWFALRGPFLLALSAALGASSACRNDAIDAASTSVSASSSSGAGGGASADCPSCTTSDDCANGWICAQLGGDSYCAPACPNGNECSADRTCMAESGVDGTQQNLCVAESQICNDTDGTGGSGTLDMCGPIVGPDIAAACTGCKPPNQCQPNGCYAGWWCNTASNKCQAPLTSCNGLTVNAGAPVTGSVGNNGGKLSRLLFAVVGDTRPAVVDDTAGYPVDIVTKIYQDLEAFNPHPPFLVSTGDYVFAKANGAEAKPQLKDYLMARALFSGMTYPGMGNHECTGATASNCGTGNADGLTVNYNQFLSLMLGPINQTKPYYVIDIDATDGSWTSKFVFIAGNAWDSAQSAWLDNALSKTTTYTFIIRHEPASATEAPGVAPSEQIMAQHPYTLAIVGHTHTYKRTSNREIIVGNGGAPLTGSKNYGYAILNQRADNAIQVDMVDYQSGLGDGSFHFALNPDGTAAP